ncbi:styrene monooxygenase/indole monooxygenase family protein [uncultured Paenalcaligenes sp.]|uniref:styrene monooxygenase/indole monooxygenase family protein n=1 Tax=uncultured Paenalcaligenes sp. TaxID=1588925 RepID=UPI002617D5EF|nr:styrene monooxygenase/indole monooxygenase family protein [uncultured Paenalcaligenes sp.]
MRKIAIIGGGQAGMPVAFGLLDKGYEVALYTNRTPDQIRDGRVMSSQCMFANALDVERRLGINYWEDECPPVEGIGFALPNPDKPDTKAVDWSGRLDRVAQATDQRIKMPVWIEEFEKRGGQVIFEDVGVAELERISNEYELTILAAGKGEVVRLFERDASRSPYDKPQRALALTYVHGLEPTPEYSRVSFNFIPGVGEYFVFPSLTLSGPCDIMVFEGIPGGPLDRFRDAQSPQEHFERSLSFLQEFLPWEADRARNCELTDAQGYLAGSFPPTVRKPVLTLPSGNIVLGMGDAVVVNDPITGQGSNNAAKCAQVYLDRILERSDQPFDRDWMEGTFEKYWDYANRVVSWTNSMLVPPTPQALALLTGAEQHPDLAHFIANAFDNPPVLYPAWGDLSEAEKLIQSKANVPATA